MKTGDEVEWRKARRVRIGSEFGCGGEQGGGWWRYNTQRKAGRGRGERLEKGATSRVESGRPSVTRRQMEWRHDTQRNNKNTETSNDDNNDDSNDEKKKV